MANQYAGSNKQLENQRKRRSAITAFSVRNDPIVKAAKAIKKTVHNANINRALDKKAGAKKKKPLAGKGVLSAAGRAMTKVAKKAGVKKVPLMAKKSVSKKAIASKPAPSRPSTRSRSRSASVTRSRKR